ncbi:MAG: hypothetical protein H7647_09925 [Candidatus Heimdallarchaeota archaeon]|nr:hypothetical protein [Candidatus Heimdallarchaeota archaeon]MCK4254743.1 hypothetical protein [Candidatus Heimdallarchaeota archaeon]
MNKMKLIIPLILLIVTPIFILPTNALIPEDQVLILDQQYLTREAIEGENITIGIIVKNFFNYTITDVNISLDLTDEVNALRFTSCDFGSLTNKNVTLNSTMQSSDENEFTATNITYGYMTESYLTFNVSQILNGTQVIFYYNITSDEDRSAQIPYVKMSYYDNWKDFQEIQSLNRLLLNFLPLNPPIDPVLPCWDCGVSLPNVWGWIILGLAPILFGAIISSVLYIRRR